MLCAQNVVMEIGNPLPARNGQVQIFIPSSRCIETLFQKKLGYLSMMSAGEEYPS